jgi:sigma-B regulation protein RsbU (phosphoserine phosphatase)
MATEVLRRQLEDRRDRLNALITREGPDADFVRLLRQVDSVLARMDTDDYGRCLVCNLQVNEADLRGNPMLEYCLCDLSADQQRSLQKDLDLARRIQTGLLPDPALAAAGWEASYRYEPAGVVSGDYCDLWIRPDDASAIYFAVGDVSGKGIAASLLMAHLQSAFRSLVGAGVPLADLASRVNRQLLEAAIPTHYATIAFGRAGADGRLEIVNAGHCPPLVLRGGGVEKIGATGFPVGLLSDKPYEVAEWRLDPGDALVLYTDGLIEARSPGGDEYGEERVERALLRRAEGHASRGIVREMRSDLEAFLAGAERSDDLTVLALRRAA